VAVKLARIRCYHMIDYIQLSQIYVAATLMVSFVVLVRLKESPSRFDEYFRIKYSKMIIIMIMIASLLIVASLFSTSSFDTLNIWTFVSCTANSAYIYYSLTKSENRYSHTNNVLRCESHTELCHEFTRVYRSIGRIYITEMMLHCIAISSLLIDDYMHRIMVFDVIIIVHYTKTYYIAMTHHCLSYGDANVHKILRMIIVW
jgi:hypothetical protein